MAKKKPLAPLAWRRLVKYLMEYESDTFSASGWQLTQKQAERIAAGIVMDNISDLDGVQITARRRALQR